MRASARAGRAALARGAWDEARVHLEAALAEREDPSLLEALGWAGWWLADEALTLTTRERAYRLYRAAGDDAAAGRVATWLATDFREFRGDDAIGRGWLHRAHRLLDGLPETADHGWLALVDADFALNLDRDLGLMLVRARDAARLGRRLAVPDLEAVGLALEGLALVGSGAVGDGMRALDEAARSPPARSCGCRSRQVGRSAVGYLRATASGISRARGSGARRFSESRTDGARASCSASAAPPTGES